MGWAGDMNDLPIVGKAFDILAHHTTAVIQCNCETPTVMVLIGFGHVMECGGCHKQYAIAKPTEVTVGIVRTSSLIQGES